MILEMDLQVIWAFEPMHQSPFSLVVLGDPKASEDTKLRTARAAKAKPYCCREPGMEDPLWEFYISAEDLTYDMEFAWLMQNWNLVAMLCSMQVERLLARVKSCTQTKRPPAERVCASGFLSEWNAAHLAAGGRNTKYFEAGDLIQAGAPLNAASDDAEGMPKRARGNILYMSEKYKEFTGIQGKQTYQNTLAVKRGFCDEFWTLPEATRDRYDLRAQNTTSTDLDLPDMPEAVNDYNRNGKNVL